MADDLVIVPSDGDGYIQLARTKTGKLFRKHLLSFGNLRHPDTKKIIKVDEKFAKTLKQNFDNNVCDIVQVPLADANNRHSEDPERNIGEVVDIQIDPKKGIYAVIDVRDPKHAEKMGKTYLGASAMMSLDYEDTKSGNRVGPTLLHSCVTNRPYVTGLENYEEIVAATSDSSQGAVLLTTDVVEREQETAEETPEMGNESKNTEAAKPTLEELLTALKTDHNIDVTALQAKAAEGDQAASLSQALTQALTDAGIVKLSNDAKDEVKTETVVTAVAELAESNLTLTNRVKGLEKSAAEHAVDALISEGRIKPAKRDFFVGLKLSNPEVFDEVVPEEPIVKLGNEEGVTPKDDAAHTKNVDEEVVRLSNLVASLNGKK